MLKLSWLAVAALMLSGAVYAEEKKEPHAHDHDAAGPNGGTLLEVGDAGDHHVEIKLDHATGKASFWLLGKDTKTAVALATKEAPKVNLKSKDGNKKIEMKPVNEKDGKASQWEATDDGFKDDHADGRIQFKLEDGKTYNVKLDPHGGKDHKH